MRKAQWLPRSESQGLGLPAEGRFPFLIQKILQSRGIEPSGDLENFFNPKLTQLKDPFSLLNMDKAVARLKEAFLKNEKICIYGDFDLDGTSGLALLKSGLEQMGYKELQYYQPKRLTEGYGLHAKVVEELANQGVQLILTVDLGITAMDACEVAKAKSVDVVITDHHQPADELPEAVAIVNPNQKGDTSGCGYLCGAGVGFYLLRALARELTDSQLIQPDQVKLKSLLDCFTIATVTDMVPLVEDNRTLVKQGLIELQKTERQGLRALIKSLGFGGRSLSSQDLAIRIAPKINALSRMELGVRPIDLYLVEDELEAEQMVETVLDNNNTRVQLQGSGEQEAFEMLKDWQEPDFVFLASKSFHRGVVGLIATKVASETHKPTFVGSLSEDGIVTGSARLPNGSESSLIEIFQSGKEFFDRFGGHEAAAGFELQERNIPQVIKSFKDYLASEKSAPRPRTHYYDTEARLEELTEGFMKWVDHLGPFGQGFEVPLLKLQAAKVSQRMLLKEQHLKLKLEIGQTGKVIDALYFSCPSEHWARDLKKGDWVEVLGEVQWNYFTGTRSLQVLIKDLRPASESLARSL
ncbi:MAG: single-stranded-DNA-specific exonuclease RecJ [Proteobacteria bacterium]|jgi:single-stranded-DNA-specific exonuclease|nr:single-stranded-DNA-specific exonuclease RecJ [Pseudomonadota bacterium]